MLRFLQRLINAEAQEETTRLALGPSSDGPPRARPVDVSIEPSSSLTQVESRSHPGTYYYKNPMPPWLPDLPDIRGDGLSFEYEIAGVSHNQSVLNAIVGGRQDATVYFRAIAVLSTEPENPHDPRAIAVHIAGQTVGYIKQFETDRFHKSFEKFGVLGGVQCKAMIVGGWDHGGGDVGSFGVRLDIDFPIEIRGKGIVRPVSRDKRFSEIGRLDDVCPYCGTTLAKRPGSKTKCQSCGNSIFVRTRPFDRRRVLLTQAQAKVVEREWGQYMQTRHS